MQGKKVKATLPPLFNEPITLENIGKFIKARRTQQGITTLDCAMLCNISAHTLNKAENGFEGVRLSLAGVQAKLPIIIKDEKLGLGDGRLSSTHIMKFQTKKHLHIVVNEFFYMSLVSYP